MSNTVNALKQMKNVLNVFFCKAAVLNVLRSWTIFRAFIRAPSLSDRNNDIVQSMVSISNLQACGNGPQVDNCCFKACTF